MHELAIPKVVGTIARPPEMSRELGAKIENLKNGRREGTEAFKPEFPAALIGEAKAALFEMDRRMLPAHPDSIEKWLIHLRAAYGIMTPPEFNAKLTAILLTSGDLPAWIWSKAALRDAMLEFSRFFPTAGELDKLLRPRCEDMSHTRFWLKHVAQSREKQPVAPEETVALPRSALPPGMKSRRGGM